MISKLIKSSLKKILSTNFILPFNKGNRFIFIYHDISEESAPQYSTHYSTKPDVFKKQLAFFKEHYSLVSLDEIVGDNLPKGKNYACIVFDDGFKSVKELAAPILQQNNIPFAVFVNKMAVELNRLWVSDFELGKKAIFEAENADFASKELNNQLAYLKSNRRFNNSIATIISEKDTGIQIYLNEADIIQLHEQGVIIGSHSLSHPVLSNCDKDIQEKEIIDNKQYLDLLLNQNTIHFAFPFGKKEHFNEDVLDILKNSGHKYFYSSNPIRFKESEIQFGLIPRIGISNESPQELMFYVNRQFLKKINL